MTAGRKSTVGMFVMLAPMERNRLRAEAERRGLTLRALVLEALGAYLGDPRTPSLLERVSKLEDRIDKLEGHWP